MCNCVLCSRLRCPGVRVNNENDPNDDEWYCSANVLARRPTAITFDGPTPTRLSTYFISSVQASRDLAF